MTDVCLLDKSCVPCAGGVPPLTDQEMANYLPEVPGWAVIDGHHLSKQYLFDNFVQALAFVNRIAVVAELQGHHPDIYFTWGKVRVDIFTHKIDGLTESDFVLAAKIDHVL